MGVVNSFLSFVFFGTRISCSFFGKRAFLVCCWFFFFWFGSDCALHRFDKSVPRFFLALHLLYFLAWKCIFPRVWVCNGHTHRDEQSHAIHTETLETSKTGFNVKNSDSAIIDEPCLESCGSLLFFRWAGVCRVLMLLLLLCCMYVHTHLFFLFYLTLDRALMCEKHSFRARTYITLETKVYQRNKPFMHFTERAYIQCMRCDKRWTKDEEVWHKV